MKPWMILVLCAPLMGCNLKEAGQNTETPLNTQPVSEKAASADRNANNASNDINPEPEITGRLSTDMKDAEGKKLTRCEYRYLHKNGDFVSVVADFRGPSHIKVTERKSAEAEINVFEASKSSAPDAKRIVEYLHKLDTYGRIPGPLNWVDAPERPNWSDDESTTWLIINFEDIQFIVSSRQQLPEHRYKAFHSIYTYMTSFVSGFHRKMRQNIGEPAAEITKRVHGKKVKLVPGTGNTVLDGAEIDYGSKLWWVEEEFVGRFESTESSLNISKEQTEEGIAEPTRLIIDKKGNIDIKIGDIEYIGSLSSERLYRVSSTLFLIQKTPENEELLKKEGRLTNGMRCNLDYDDGGDENIKEYSRMKLFIPGEPYVEGLGFIPSKTIFVDRK